MCLRSELSPHNPKLSIRWNLAQVLTHTREVLEDDFIRQFGLELVGLRPAFLHERGIPWPIVVHLYWLDTTLPAKGGSARRLTKFCPACAKNIQYFFTTAAHGEKYSDSLA
jgi:hypothetical protein